MMTSEELKQADRLIDAAYVAHPVLHEDQVLLQKIPLKLLLIAKKQELISPAMDELRKMVPVCKAHDDEVLQLRREELGLKPQ
ncbi:MAG TPA: hypothetical protein VLG69_01195 [Candidatus Andersenbacteria bacterium]|nr:hypothetical protein [Candidatus Andersenbacteria bacterium]